MQSDGMQVRTKTERVRHSRRMVPELLASSVDKDLYVRDYSRWIMCYKCVKASGIGA